MKHYLLIQVLVSICAISTLTVSAQELTIKKDTTRKTSHWVIGTTYQSDQVYLGRKDSVAVPYFSPSIGYHDKSGFFVTGTASYLPGNGENRFDVFSIEGGYSYSSDKVNLELSAAKDFYSDQSFAVTSEIGARMSANFSYDFGFIEPSIDLGAEFSGSTDIGIGLGIAHSFTLIDDKFEVDPSFKVNAASQNYYANYYNKRKYSAKRNGGKSTSAVVANLVNPARFAIMDYELEAPFEYTLNKKLKLNFTPTLAIPTNPATVAISTKQGTGTTSKTVTESLPTAFYFSLGVSLTL